MDIIVFSYCSFERRNDFKYLFSAGGIQAEDFDAPGLHNDNPVAYFPAFKYMFSFFIGFFFYACPYIFPFTD